MAAKNSLMFDLNPVPLICFQASDRTVSTVNKAFSSQYIPESDIVGSSLDSVLNPLHRDNVSFISSQHGGFYSLRLPNDQFTLVEVVEEDAPQLGDNMRVALVQELFPDPTLARNLDHPLYKAVFDKSRDIILVADDEGNFIEVNETACRLLGYRRDELLSMSVIDITYKPMRSYGNKKWEEFIQTGIDEGEYMIEAKDGTVIHTEYRAIANIQPGKHLSVLRDITRHKKLEKQDFRLAKIMESSLSCIAFLDDDFNVYKICKTCLQEWGFEKQEEVKGKHIENFFAQTNRFAVIRAELERRGVWEGVLLAKRSDQSQFDVQLSIKRLQSSEDDPVKWLVSFMNISKQVYAERELRKSQNKLNRILEAAPNAIMIFDQDGRIEYCNPRSYELFGYECRELIGEKVEKLVPEELHAAHREKRKGYLKDPQIRPMGSGFDFHAVRKDGTRFPVDIMLGPLEENGQIKTFAIIRDISKFKSAQVKLKNEQEFTELLQKLTEISNQVEELEEALQQTLKHICEFMDWPLGHVYLPSEEDPELFESSGIWYSMDRERHRPFMELTHATDFRPGEGMVGKIIADGKPHWVTNAHSDTDFVRRFEGLDLQIRACFGFPVLVRESVVGVVEFFSNDVHPSDTTLLKKMATIGNQLGRIVERIETQKSLSQSETKFKTLFNTAKEAILILQDHEVIECNPSTYGILNTTEKEIVGKSLYELFCSGKKDEAQARNRIKKQIRRAEKGRSTNFEWEFTGDNFGNTIAEVDLIPIKIDQEKYIHARIRDIRAQKEADKLIKRNAELFRQLFANSPVGVVMLDQNSKVSKVNESFRKIFGYRESEIVNRRLDDLIVQDEDLDGAIELTDKTFSGSSFYVESERLHKQGHKIPVLVGGTPVIIDNETIAVFGIYIDITERKKAEKKIQLSLKEKDVLLQEIHHRVKNNLALVSGLLELQANHEDHPRLVQAMRDSQTRIQSIALVHEQLYQFELFSSLRLDKYIDSLSSSIIDTHSAPNQTIELEINADPISLSMPQAIPCGLLLNELLTNAIKHAFPDSDKGRITINLRYKIKENTVHLEVSDNGIGLSDDVRLGKSESLGLTLIQTLTKQLEGDMSIATKTGTTFQIIFKKKDDNVKDRTS